MVQTITGILYVNIDQLDDAREEREAEKEKKEDENADSIEENEKGIDDTRINY